MMPKSDTIDAIRKLNPSANPDFLAEFSKDQLGEYLDRLASATAGRSVQGAFDLTDLDGPSGIARPVTEKA